MIRASAEIRASRNRAFGLAVAVAVVALLLGPATGCSAAPPGPQNAAQTQGGDKKTTVSLTVDFGDGFQKVYTRLPHRSEMTVLDATLAAAAHERGIKVNYRGRGDRAFVTAIDKLENQGGRGRNWLFQVNGKQAERGCGATRLKPGDTVLWKFDKYR